MEKQQQQQQQQEGANGAESSEPKKGDQYESDFYTTGRIGRRNALPDILGNNYTTTKTSDLPLKFSALTTNGELLFQISSSFILYFIFLDTPNQPGPSGSQPPTNPNPN